jgi:catechol 2,3-dioxygenase-like lactoylglutathione lyase family enzyme
MPIVGIDHIVLTCSDVEKMVAWYRDELGLEPLRLDEWRRGEVLFVSLRVNEGTIIDLFAGERTGENMNPVAFVLHDADLDALAASGRFAVEKGPLELFGARGTGRGFYTHDPEGNRVELRSYS